MASLPFLSSSVLFMMSTILTTSGTATTSTTMKITLSPFPHHPSSDHHQIFKNLATSSLARAHRLKHQPDDLNAKAKPEANTSSSLLKIPLYSHSYGAYTISLDFGNPPQTLPFVIDTASSLTWFPCTSTYLCADCKNHNEPIYIPTFLPNLSSSTKYLGCDNPKCSWLAGPNVGSFCRDCKPSKYVTCSPYCPPYFTAFSTFGFLLEENLVFPQKTFQDFLVGCSTITDGQPAGIAGFGRRPESLPSQLDLNKFSYCLVSRQFDDTDFSGTMLLETESGPGNQKTPGLSYTPLYKNEVPSNPVLEELYYVRLRKIVVGNTRVKIPYRFLVSGSDGNGGTIVDSLSPLTFMERPVFELVLKEFEKQLGNYSRAREVEGQSYYTNCYHIPFPGHNNNNKSNYIDVPELSFQFKGGAKMALPVDNYIAFVQDNVACLILVTDHFSEEEFSRGPAIILGTIQQQNYYVEFDLANERFGFAKQSCVSS